MSLKTVYKDHFMIGTAIMPSSTTGKRAAVIQNEFNAITAENNMKPILIQEKKGNFTYEEADKIVNFALENNMTMIGHTLCWHQQTPEWMYTNVSKESAIENLRTHIENVGAKYKGKVYSWDVLNEIFNDGIENPKDWRSALRNSPWLEAIGEEYIELAFKFASEAAPDALLYYNDYNLNYPAKREVTYLMVKELKEKGVKIDGIGMQGHYNMSTTPESVEDSIALFSKLDVKISITEFDITFNEAQGQEKLTQEQEKQHAFLYASIFSIFKKYKHIIERVTFWGLDDKTSWRADRFPLLFNADLSPKLCYNAILDPEKFVSENPMELTKLIEPVIGTVYKDTGTCVNVNQYTMAWEGATGTADINWNDEGLEILVDVKDGFLNADNASHREQDSVEIFIDENAARSHMFHVDDYAFNVNYKNKLTMLNGENPDITTTAEITETGYKVHAKIKFKTIKPKEGTVIGFEIGINDADKSGRRVSVAKFCDTTEHSDKSTANYGQLILK